MGVVSPRKRASARVQSSQLTALELQSLREPMMVPELPAIPPPDAIGDIPIADDAIDLLDDLLADLAPPASSKEEIMAVPHLTPTSDTPSEKDTAVYSAAKSHDKSGGSLSKSGDIGAFILGNLFD